MSSTFTPLFSTYLWKAVSTIDNDRLLEECYHMKRTKIGTKFSNRGGGYQGNDFRSKELDTFIKDNIPKSKINVIDKASVFYWVNINGKGAWNFRHNHFQQNGSIIFSGIYYVKTPKKSGVIRFYDPRNSMIYNCLDMQYFYGLSVPMHEIEPQAGECYYFPSWLEHDVEFNESEEDRVSIAFNLHLNVENFSTSFNNKEL